MGKLKAASQARRSRPDEHVDVRQKVCSYERLPADILRKYNAAAAGRRERAFLSGSRIRRKRKALRLCHCWYCLALSSLFEISSLLFLSTIDALEHHSTLSMCPGSSVDSVYCAQLVLQLHDIN
jgi:hypothetical protein